MKSKRFQFKYRAGASKLHKKVGDLMRSSSILNGYNFLQEYPVSSINPGYEGTREHFDWVSTDLKVVIECHGEQHYHPVCFGGITMKQAIDNYEGQKERDASKQGAALAAGWGYLSIPYDTKINEQYLIELISSAVSSRTESILPPAQKVDWTSEYKKKKKIDKDSGRADTIKQKARLRSKEQYQKMKAWKKKREAETDDSK